MKHAVLRLSIIKTAIFNITSHTIFTAYVLKAYNESIAASILNEQRKLLFEMGS